MTLQQWLDEKTPEEIAKFARRWGTNGRELTFHVNGRKELPYSVIVAAGLDCGLAPELIAAQFKERRAENKKPFSQRTRPGYYVEPPAPKTFQALCIECRGQRYLAIRAGREFKRFIWCRLCDGKGTVTYDGSNEPAQVGSTNLDGRGNPRVTTGDEEDEGSTDSLGAVINEDRGPSGDE